jgi:DNA-binding NtrC family response regulator
MEAKGGEQQPSVHPWTVRPFPQLRRHFARLLVAGKSREGKLKSSGQLPAPVTTTAPSGDRTVLLLECERGLREIMAEGLGHYGYQVICALTAKHAAWICRDHGGLIDLLLADVSALGERPLDCLQTIQGTEPHLPVLLASAYDRQTVLERHPELLASHEFLAKPFAISHLANAIEILLQLHKTQRNFDLQDRAWNTKPSKT